MRSSMTARLLATSASLVLFGWAVSCASKPRQQAASAPEAVPSAVGSSEASPSEVSPSAGSSPEASPSRDKRTTGGSGPVTAAGRDHAQTAEERHAALDRKLNDSLGSFDAKLRKEQQKSSAERDARQRTSAGCAASEKPAASGAASSGTADGSEAGNPGTGKPGIHGGKHADPGNPGTRPGDLHSGKAVVAGGRAVDGGNGARAREIPDGSDDDIVARRLRKVAEQETDPELKDKLWKEYLSYKKNAHGS